MPISFQAHKQTLRTRRLVNDINITPMVDVMLVLLIIFMVTAPMLVAGIEVNLPKTELKSIPRETQPIIVSINKKHEIYIGENKIHASTLIPKLQHVAKSNKNTKIFVRGDQIIPYGIIMDTISLIQKAGFTKVALITDTK